MFRSLALLAALLATAARADEVALRELVGQTLPRVAAVMGIAAPAQVKVAVLTRAAAEQRLRAGLLRDYPGDALTRLGEALAAVGLAAAGTDLERLAPDFYARHASGFYDAGDRTLYLIDDQSMERQALVVAHELAHALQDTVVNLNEEGRRRRDSEDASLALAAAIEGQAQAVAARVMELDLRDAGVDVPGMGDLISSTASGSAAQASEEAPTPWLGLQLRFPYQAGGAFLAAVRTPADPIARHLLQRLPASTAQVLAVDAYRRNVALVTPALGWMRGKEAWGTTLGRAGVDLLGAPAKVSGLGEGWRGDRLEVTVQSGAPAVVWAVAFEKPEQARRLEKLLAGRGPVRVEGRVVVLLAGLRPGEQGAARRAAFTAFHAAGL